MRLALAAFALLASLLAPPARADGFTPAQRAEVVGILRDALRSDPGILRDALGALRADDDRKRDQVTRDVLTLLAGKIADPADPVEGNPLGDVTIVEFYDTRCPYCKGMLPELAALLRADANVRIVMKDIPILGNASQLESRFLLAAQRQGAYFRMMEAVMTATAPSSRDGLRALADQLGFDGARMLRDMDDPAIKARLQNNLDLAHQIGIDGTPAFVIGTRLIAGASDLKELQQAVYDARKARKGG